MVPLRSRLPAILCVLLISALLGACTTPPRTTELQAIGAPDRYGWPGDRDGSREDTLFIVTASGGGTRAAALTLGTLRALKSVKLADPDRSLLDEVDIISSVSGGSVTSAYFAFAGAEGFNKLEHNFIRNNGIRALALRFLNPVNLAEIATDAKSRLDLQIDYLDSSLFGNATFESLTRQKRRPYLILNAADMSEGAVFSFTQPKFDLICADLNKFKLSEAVAASAAFPVALAPLAIKSYAPCQAQWTKYEELSGKQRRWPPLWVQNALRTSIDLNPDRTRRGRLAERYLNLRCDAQQPTQNCEALPEGQRKAWVHLLDGGIADNLGLNEPLCLLTTVDNQLKDAPSFLNQIFSGKIRNVVVVVVNARSEADSDLDRSGATPGMLKMLTAATDSSVDAASFGMQDRLAATIRDLVLLQAKSTNFQPFVQNAEKLKTFVVPVDFDYIADPACRRVFKNIKTSWVLKGSEIDGLESIAGALVRRAPAFDDLLNVYDAQRPKGPDVASVCHSMLKQD